MKGDSVSANMPLKMSFIRPNLCWSCFALRSLHGDRSTVDCLAKYEHCLFTEFPLQLEARPLNKGGDMSSYRAIKDAFLTGAVVIKRLMVQLKWTSPYFINSHLNTPINAVSGDRFARAWVEAMSDLSSHPNLRRLLPSPLNLAA